MSAEESPAPRRSLSLRQHIIVVAIMAVVSLLSVIVLSTYPGSWVSKSQLHVRTFPPKVIFETREPQSDIAAFRATQIQMIKSRAVLGPALRDPKVITLSIFKDIAEPAEWLEQKLKLSFPAGSELLTVSIALDDPTACEPIVNAVIKAYLETVIEEDHQTRIQRLERLKKLYDKYQEELRTKRQSLRMLSNSVGPEDRANVAISQQFKLESLQTVQREYLQLQSQLRSLEAEKVVLQDADKAVAAEQTAKIDKQITLAKARESLLLKAIERHRMEFTKLNGTTIDLETEKADLKLIEETTRKIGQEVEALDVELQAPRRISVWTPADTPRWIPWWRTPAN